MAWYLEIQGNYFKARKSDEPYVYIDRPLKGISIVKNNDTLDTFNFSYNDFPIGEMQNLSIADLIAENGTDFTDLASFEDWKNLNTGFVNEPSGSLNNNITGWATYVDTVNVDLGSAQVIPADTDTILTNNAGSKIETQKPVHVTTFYDGTTNKITGRNGDNLDCMIYFKAVPSSSTQYLDIWIDIGGSIGELYRETFTFPKGAGVERGILYALPSAYTLNTWETNGGTIYIRSNSELSVYSKNYNFDLSHKAI